MRSIDNFVQGMPFTSLRAEQQNIPKTHRFNRMDEHKRLCKQS